MAIKKPLKKTKQHDVPGLVRGIQLDTADKPRYVVCELKKGD
jgi:hypothetical protein